MTAAIPLDLRVTTIDNFYESVREPEAGQAFLDVMALRAEGYGPEYPRTILPLDRTDFFCRHHVVYLGTSGRWDPVACYKHVPISWCEYYGHEFPLVSAMKLVDSQVHREAVELLIDECKQANREILYGGGMTVKRAFRGQSQTAEVLRRLVAALLYLDTQDFRPAACVTAAATRFKVDRFFNAIGYRPVRMLQEELPDVPYVSMADEPVRLLRVDEMSSFAVECFEAFRAVVDARVVIGSRSTLKLSA